MAILSSGTDIEALSRDTLQIRPHPKVAKWLVHSQSR